MTGIVIAMRAKDVMSSNLTVVPPEMPVADIARLLAGRGISAVPVVGAEGDLLGLVTEGDLIRRLADEPRGPFTWFLDLFRTATPTLQRFVKARGKTARDVMTAELVTAEESAGLDEIARLMEERHIRRVPVLRQGKLVGIVSRADLLRAVLQQPEEPVASGEATLLQAVVQALRSQPWTDTFWVYPSVEGSEVTLYGYARSDDMRKALAVLIRDVPGVTKVEDSMKDMPLLMRASF
jgi:CBS domain-containing protein